MSEATMAACFGEKKGRVIVIDPSGPVRQMMSDVVRSLGFETVQSRPSIAEAMAGLETESADWIIMPLMADQPANALHLLKICTEIPQLKSMRISLVLAEDELYVLPAAFELGALSWHIKPFTKETLNSELKTLLEMLSTYSFNEVLASASYLRKYLQAAKEYKGQFALERQLLDLFPGDASILFNMVEPQFNLDRKPQARAALKQVKIINPTLAPKADELAKKLFPEGLGGSDATSEPILGIKSCVIIDSDATTCKAAEDILTSVGITEVKKFENGADAAATLEAGTEPELIIMEWRIPKLTGPLLVQRIRKKFSNVPIVILSSLLKVTDIPLTKEMGIANILTKPLHRDGFLSGLIYTLQQEKQPTEYQSLERKIRRALISGNKDEAEKLKNQFLGNPDIPLAKKRQIEAEAAYHAGNFTLAKEAGIESLKLSGDSIIILNLLGKTFMGLADYGASLKCFKKAQDLSPNNIERLCNIAEAQIELGDEKAANTSLESAKLLDPDSKTVADAEIKCALAKGDTSVAKTLMADMDSLSGIVAYMNNKAVAHAKCGHVDEAQEMYADTIQSIPEEQGEIRSVVLYNLALALIKASNFDEAKDALEKVIASKKTKVSVKAKSLLDRLRQSIEKGSDLHLRQVIHEPTAEADKSGKNTETAASGLSTLEDHAKFIAMVEARKGDLCCYMVYNHPETLDVRASSLLAKQPRFQLRQAIEREEAMKTERAS